MPVASHTTVAEQRNNVATEHKAAADLRGKGWHARAMDQPTTVQACKACGHTAKTASPDPDVTSAK